MTPLDRSWITIPLTPLSWLYGLAVRARNARYEAAEAVRKVGVPVISVGNLTVGGTGKTPVVAWLAKRLVDRGVPTAVVSRGYGGRAGRGPLLVSDGSGPRVHADVCGDEPFLLARSLPGTAIWVGSERVGVATAARTAGARVIVLDDGFQHRRLYRDLDIVLIDSLDPPARAALLPAGRLREPLSSLRRAHVVLATRCRSDEDLDRVRAVVGRYSPVAPVLAARHRPAGFFDPDGRPSPRPARALGFCAIGNPASFRDDLAGVGVELAGFRSFRDHHRYRAEEISGLARVARSLDAVPVTTEKDLARIGPERASADLPGLRVLRIEATVEPARELMDRVGKVLEGRTS